MGSSRAREAAPPPPLGDTLRCRGKSVCSAGDSPPLSCNATTETKHSGFPSPVLTDFPIDTSAIVAAGRTADRLLCMGRFLLVIGISLGAAGLLALFSGRQSTQQIVFVQQTPEVAATSIVEEEEAENGAAVPSSVTTDDRTENVTIVTKSVQGDGMVFVQRVIDGDTIEIEGGERVRYIGVNTPESVDPRRKMQCFGKEAAAYNVKLVEGKRVRLEADVEDRDRYGRLLRYVWLGDTMINEQLVADGYAQIMTIPPNVKYVERFRVAQTEAREVKRGLWEKCK